MNLLKNKKHTETRKETAPLKMKRGQKKAEERCTAEESGKRKKEKQIRGITIKNFFVK